jgi:nucleoside-diphosphate-sugar epimerase
MNVVVFGAAGWLGRAIIANLDAGHEVRAFDRGPESWNAWSDVDGEWTDGRIVHGDIAEYSQVDEAMAGMDAIVHAAVYSSRDGGDRDTLPFLVNLKGLWNVLESGRRHNVKRVVHIGSCHAVHPKGEFYSADVRSVDGSLYAVTKRLQEEMCRQFYDAFQMRIIVLRPDYIVDSRLGIGKYRQILGPPENPRLHTWVCRHDLAQACRLAIENESIEFDIFHVVDSPEAEKTCNVARSREILGLEYRGDLDQYR